MSHRIAAVEQALVCLTLVLFSKKMIILHFAYWCYLFPDHSFPLLLQFSLKSLTLVPVSEILKYQVEHQLETLGHQHLAFILQRIDTSFCSWTLFFYHWLHQTHDINTPEMFCNLCLKMGSLQLHGVASFCLWSITLCQSRLSLCTTQSSRLSPVEEAF